MSEINEHPEILLYTRIRKSPYFYASRRHGVQLYSVYNHHYHPRHYGDPVEEYWQLLNGVTLWDVGVEKQIQIIEANDALPDADKKADDKEAQGMKAGAVALAANLDGQTEEFHIADLLPRAFDARFLKKK